MLKKITILSVILLIATTVFYINMAHSHGDGSQGLGYSGSPGDGKNCGTSGCHNTTATTVTGWITSNIPAAGYVGGTQYTVTCKFSSGTGGFEITCEKSGGTKVGVFSSTGVTGISFNSTKTSAVTTTNVSTKTLTWTAPAAGTGTITFYACFAATSSQAKNCTLSVNEACSMTASINPTSPTICSGSSATLTASATGATSYSWYVGSTSNPIIVSPTTNTTYTVTATSTSCTASSSVTVTVNQTPAIPVITQTTGNTLSSSATTGNQWYEQSAGIIAGATNQTYTPTINGIYYTIVTVNGCPSSSSNKITIIITGVPLASEKNNMLSFYPNPAFDKLMVIVPDASYTKLSVYNIQGQLLIEKTSLQKISSINISNLEKGIYFLKAESSKGIVIKRFIKE